MDEYERKIYKLFDTRNEFRFNELKRKVVNEEKICSERPFREKLSNLVESKLIARVVHDKQNVTYTKDLAMPETIKNTRKFFQDELDGIEKFIAKFEKNIDKFSDLEIAEISLMFYKILHHLHYKSAYLSEIARDDKISQEEKIFELQRKIIGLPFKLKKKNVGRILECLSLVDKIWTEELREEFDKMKNLFKNKKINS